MDFDGLTNAKTLFATAMQKQAANAAAQAGGANMKKVKETAQKFEAFFVGSMMQSMTADMEPDEIFGGGHGEEMWRSMLNQEYGKEVAKSGRLGIADNVTKAMLKMQEERTKAVEDVLKMGDELLVKVIEIDNQGRVNLSRKVVLKEEKEAAEKGKNE